MQSLTEQLRPLFGVNGVVCPKKKRENKKNQKRSIMESIIETKAITILQFFQGLHSDVYVTFEEGTWRPLEFELPPVQGTKSGPWRRWIDTFLESPQDIVEWRRASPVSGCTYQAGPRSVVVLWASLGNAAAHEL